MSVEIRWYNTKTKEVGMKPSLTDLLQDAEEILGNKKERKFWYSETTVVLTKKKYLSRLRKLLKHYEGLEQP